MAENVGKTLDYVAERIPRLFRKIFIPTLLGMLSDVAFMLTVILLRGGVRKHKSAAL